MNLNRYKSVLCFCRVEKVPFFVNKNMDYFSKDKVESNLSERLMCLDKTKKT